MQEQIYTRSNGEQIPLKQLETTHLLNSLNKEYREIFNSQNKKEVSKRLEKINMLKNEYYRRLYDFNDRWND